MCKKITPEMVENKIIERISSLIGTKNVPEELSDVVDVRSFEGYLVTRDRGVVIDLRDGNQIRLTVCVD